jgi:MFS family permease
VLFAAYAVVGVADSLRLPASMALFVEEGERLDSVASSMSVRSFSWKVGQVIGPAMAGVIKEFVSTAAAFFAAAGIVFAATVAFVVMYARFEATAAESPGAAPGD